MKHVLSRSIFWYVLLSSSPGLCQENPAASSPSPRVGENEDGSFYVPTEQLLDPAGFQVTFPGRPVDLALSPDEKTLAVKNRRDLILMDVDTRRIRVSLSLPGGGHSVTGILFSPDGKTIYTTDASKSIHRARIGDHGIATWDTPIVLPPPAIGGVPAPAGLAFSNDGKELLVTLTRNNTLGIVNLETNEIQQIDTGICPFTVILTRPGLAYVSNWGGRRPKEGEPTARSSGSETLIDEETGVASSGNVTVIGLAKRAVITEIETGLHPCNMALSPDEKLLFVANANSDTVSVIDTQKNSVIHTLTTRPNPELMFGSTPTDVLLSKDGTKLYVTLGGNNAVAVYQLGSTEDFLQGNGNAALLGCIPTGWYPGAVRLNRGEDLLFCANVKGLGSLNQRTSRHGMNSHEHLGSVSFIPYPQPEKLAAMTEKVIHNNRLPELKRKLEKARSDIAPVPVPERHGEPSVFDHVIYIIKENRTYDQVFGDLPQGNGDPSLVHFGREVTPNHHALAETFTLFDNFYCSGVLSADGHQWTNEAYVTDYLERFFGDFTRSYPYDGDDPLAYASTGFIWDNVLRHGLTFRDYGEFVQAELDPPKAQFLDYYKDYLEGTHTIQMRARTELKRLEPYLCPTYVGFPNTVPDVIRVREFLKEFREFERQGSLPHFIILLLPNDHTSGTRPDRPTPRASVADNDLALGQIVEAVSHSRFWEKTCIFVVQDDPQDGLDHVDSHRTVALVISPYTRRGFVDSTMYTQPGMLKTIELILGLPPMNQFDLLATPMRACFRNEPDLTPYKALKNNIPLDEMNPPLPKTSGMQRYWAQKSLELDLSKEDLIDEDLFNRIIWHAVKGYDVPYPTRPTKSG
ncbi:MAG: alkaline phosphatase family protein [bacterium]